MVKVNHPKTVGILTSFFFTPLVQIWWSSLELMMSYRAEKLVIDKHTHTHRHTDTHTDTRTQATTIPEGQIGFG